MKEVIRVICVCALLIFGVGVTCQNESEAIEVRAIEPETEPEPTKETIPMIELEDTAVEIIPAETLFEATEITVPEDKESAFAVWKALDKAGYNDYVKAGILGNMMAEVGGQSLYLQYWLYSSDGYYYGLCQWNAGAYGSVHGTDLDSQIRFLLDTIENEFNACGHVFGYSFESFMDIQDEQEAAIVFAKVYERCGSGTYGIRQSNASVAYNYFTELYN